LCVLGPSDVAGAEERGSCWRWTMRPDEDVEAASACVEPLDDGDEDEDGDGGGMTIAGIVGGPMAWIDIDVV